MIGLVKKSIYEALKNEFKELSNMNYMQNLELQEANKKINKLTFLNKEVIENLKAKELEFSTNKLKEINNNFSSEITLQKVINKDLQGKNEFLEERNAFLKNRIERFEEADFERAFETLSSLLNRLSCLPSEDQFVKLKLLRSVFNSPTIPPHKLIEQFKLILENDSI